MLDEVIMTCPYCGEALTLLVDSSAGEQGYTEDCQVCCNPMTITVHVDHTGDLIGVEAEPENE